MKTPWWFLHKTPIAFLLWPISMLYRVASRIVFGLRGLRPCHSDRQIICVGNILAGGVGKTPIVREIAQFLSAPVVMRGYKKSAKTSGVGDEALMLNRAGIQVHTGNRKSNIRLLSAQNSRTPIVMDDGFQNSSIAKDISILVFDGKLGIGNGFGLPAGPLRESRRAIRRADAIIIVNPTDDARGARFLVRLKIPENVPVFYARNKTISPYTKGTKLFAFAGIGYPKKFFAALNNVVGRRAYSDHYQYTADDIAWLKTRATRAGAKLITTEKDWVRLSASAQDEIKYAELITEIDSEFFVWLKEKLNADAKKRS